MEEPVDIHYGRGRLKTGNSKACDAGIAVSVNEDVCLGGCERVIKV